MSPARLLVLAVLGCAVLCGAGSGLAQAQEQGPGPARAELLDLFDDVPPQLPVEQVIRFTLRTDGELAIETDMGPAPGVRQVRLRGLEGVAEVHVGRRPRGPLGLVSFFDFTYRGPAGPSGGSVQTTVNALGSQVRVTRAHRHGTVQTNVRLSQDTVPRRARPGAAAAAAAGAARAGRVVLIVKVTSSGQAVEDLRVTAGTFDELLRKHPGPAGRYLAPVFRDLGQDAAVFGVDARVAWQMFPEAAEADEALASRVLAILERFNDGDSRRREAAAADLDALGGQAVLVLGELDRETLTAEQNARVDAFLADYRRLPPGEVAALLEDPEFLLRCFTYCDEQPPRAAAVRALARLLGRDPPLDPAADLPARTRAADLLRDDLPKSGE